MVCRGISPGKTALQLSSCLRVVVLLKTSENPTLKATLWRYAVCSHLLLSLLHSLPSFSALKFRGKYKHPNSSAQDALAAQPSWESCGIHTLPTKVLL